MATRPVSTALLQFMDEMNSLREGKRAKFSSSELADWTAKIRDCGFTREDVENHRRSAAVLVKDLEQFGPAPEWDCPSWLHKAVWDKAAWHESMADRIEALLPQDTA